MKFRNLPWRPRSLATRFVILASLLLAGLPGSAQPLHTASPALPPASLDGEVVIEIPAAFPWAKMDPESGLTLNIVGQQAFIQDLPAGTLQVFDLATRATPERLAFPSELLALAFADSGQVFGLTPSGVRPFPDTTGLLAALRQPKSLPALLAQPRWTLAEGRGRYRLQVGPDGTLFLRDLDEASLRAFQADGRQLGPIPCPAAFACSGPGRVVMPFSAPQGGFLQEMILHPDPQPSGTQTEVETWRQEIGLGFSDLSLVEFKGPRAPVLLALAPPSFPDARQATSASETTESDPTPPSQPLYEVFRNPGRPGERFTVVVRLTPEGSLTPVARFPFGDAEDKVRRAGSDLYSLGVRLQPGTDQGVIRLFRHRISPN